MVPLSSSIAADDITPSLDVNSKAVLFSIGGLSNLGADAFNGGFGVKYFIAQSLALRGSLQFITASQSNPANPPAGTVGTDGSTSATQFGLTAAIEYHLTKTRVSPYVGGGLSFSTTSTTNKSAVVGAGAQIITKNRTTGEFVGENPYSGGFGFGIDGLAGVEFFIAKEVSLAAEYQLGYALLSRYNQEVVGGLTTKAGSLNTVGISSTGLLTLAFYF
jgi:hypothetical protein